MKINLIPDSKAKEQKQKRTTFLLVSVCIFILAGLGTVILVLGAMNIAEKTQIRNFEGEISETKKGIEKFSQLEKNVTNLSTGLDTIKQVFDSRKKTENIFKEIAALMPKETALIEFTVNGNAVTFKTATESVEKVAELIESLRNFEVQIKDGEENKKVKMFTQFEITDYTKENNETTGVTIYGFAFSGQITEDLWKMN